MAPVDMLPIFELDTEDQKKLDPQALEILLAYNEAAKAGDAENAAELQTKFKALGQQAADNKAGDENVVSTLGWYFHLYVEIHNRSKSQTLENMHDWEDVRGRFLSPAVGDIRPGEVAYIHMVADRGGDRPISCRALFKYGTHGYYSKFSFGVMDIRGQGYIGGTESQRSGGVIWHRKDERGILRFYAMD